MRLSSTPYNHAHVIGKRRNVIAPSLIAASLMVAFALLCSACGNPPDSDGGKSQEIQNEEELLPAEELDSQEDNSVDEAEEAAKRMAANEQAAHDFMCALYNDWMFEDGEMITATEHISKRGLPYIAEDTGLYTLFSSESNFVGLGHGAFSRDVAMNAAHVTTTMLDERTCYAQVLYCVTQSPLDQEGYERAMENLFEADWMLFFDEEGKIASISYVDSPSDQTQQGSPAASIDNYDEDVWSDCSGEYMFASGMGNWSTVLVVNSDGSFNGSFHDTDMGMTGDGYPNGTRTQCTFHGSFSAPIKVGKHAYFIVLRSLEIEDEPGETIEEGVRVMHLTDEVPGLGSPTSAPVSGFWLYSSEASTYELSPSAGRDYRLSSDKGTLDRCVIVNSSDPDREQVFVETQ